MTPAELRACAHACNEAANAMEREGHASLESVAAGGLTAVPPWLLLLLKTLGPAMIALLQKLIDNLTPGPEPVPPTPFK